MNNLDEGLGQTHSWEDYEAYKLGYEAGVREMKEKVEELEKRLNNLDDFLFSRLGYLGSNR